MYGVDIKPEKLKLMFAQDNELSETNPQKN